MRSPGTSVMSRRNFLRSSVATAGVLGIGAPLVSACGGGSGSSPDTVTFLTGEDSTDTQAVWAKMFQDFVKSGDTVKKITPEYLNPDQALDRLATLVNSGSAPDLAKFDDCEMAVLAASGTLEPVTDVVDKLNVPDRVRLRIKGEDYFIPLDIGSSFMYYRRDWFDEAGIKNVPQNWDDYLAAAERLTDPSRRRYGDLVVTNSRSGYTKNCVLNHTWSNSVDYFKWNGSGWDVSLPDYYDQAAETFAWLRKRSAYSPQTANYDYSQATQALASSAVAMMEYPGARTLAYLAQQFPKVFEVTGIAPLPYNTRPARKASIGGLVIFKKDRDPEPVKRLALSMAGGDRYLDYLWTVPGQFIPPSVDVFNGKWRTHPFIKNTPGLLDALDDGYKTSYSPLTGASAVSGAETNVAASAVFLSTAYSDLMAETLLQKKDPKSSLNAANKHLETSLSEFNS
jgi:ABC-type glycerol-3-phosphate transport system substrate-binding protein